MTECTNSKTLIHEIVVEVINDNMSDYWLFLIGLMNITNNQYDDQWFFNSMKSWRMRIEKSFKKVHIYLSICQNIKDMIFQRFFIITITFSVWYIILRFDTIGQNSCAKMSMLAIGQKDAPLYAFYPQIPSQSYCVHQSVKRFFRLGSVSSIYIKALVLSSQTMRYSLVACRSTFE